ncbi:MAG TPA: permease-like cell division protein FtsX [Mycobacteriales bacterium]|nr:permease-like cell division protein FtsX [Mycobacteriales bacterium]
MRAQFVLSEIWIGLRRNLTMTVAVIITAAISLTIFGLGLMVRNQVNVMKGFWYGKVEVSIFLKEDITQAQRDQLRAELDAMPDVERVYFEGKAEAYERFKEQFKDSPDIIANTTPDVLPESFRVKLRDPNKFEVVASAFADRPGVVSVFNQRDLLKNFFDILNAFRTVMIVFALVSLAAAAVLIGNTVRVAAFSRRRETGIMRLVGASNLYIQLPFLLEGMLAGLVGALLATGFLSVVQSLVVNGVLRDAIKASPFVGWSQFRVLVPVLVLTGMALSGIASFVTLRKYLRV